MFDHVINNKKKSQEPKSLKHRLMLFLVICWLLPILVFAVFTASSYQKVYVEKTENLIQNSTKNTTTLLSVKIEEGIRISQAISSDSDREWENVWKSYNKGIADYDYFIYYTQYMLKKRFAVDERFTLYAFYLDGEEIPSAYSSRAGISYNSFMQHVHPKIIEERKANTDYVQVKVINNKIYLIRNIYTISGYEKFGTFVTALDTAQLFKNLPMEEISDIAICINGELPLLFANGKEIEEQESAYNIYGKLKEEITLKNGSYVTKLSEEGNRGYMYQKKEDNYHISVMYAVDKSVIYAGLIQLYQIILLMLALFVPVIIFAVYYWKKQIEEPVGRLIIASHSIEEGKIGTMVEGGAMPNSEFDYLKKSFNQMSQQVKYLFDTVYSEQLARKDAQIAALQAQINPHFLNNTLEMMNWQARMSNDVIVEKMIEALSVVLDHSMNRNNEKEINLIEELRCADSYLYIMSMRFGQRLQVEKDIDQSLLRVKVPQLILQPIIENAIMHGVEKVKSGTILLRVHHDETALYIDVTNTGKALEQKDIDRIRNLLSGEKQPHDEGTGKHVSIGISNVNKRIQLVYGEEYGLSIQPLEGDKTLSRITLPYRQMSMSYIQNTESIIERDE